MMQLVKLCDMAIEQTEGVVVGPLAGGESLAWGVGHGTVTGERIQGTLTGSNHPRFRADNVNCPDLQGVIATSEGDTIFYDMRGYALPVEGQPQRTVAATMTFRTASSNYDWLNTTLGLVEGTFARPHSRFTIYECVPNSGTRQER